MPYIKELCCLDGVNDVIVISPVSDLEERKNMGWDIGEIDGNNVDVCLSPSDAEIMQIFEKYTCGDIQTWCFFSGINAFPEVTKWFRLSLDYNVKRGIITEPPYVYDHPLWQHAIRFAIKDWRYVKYIDKVFLMGDEYIRYYKFWSKNWNVVPFKYCTEWRERTALIATDEKLKVLYVGSLSARKNVGVLISAISKLSTDEQRRLEVGIIGDGEQQKMLVDMTKDNNFVSPCVFYGSKPMNEIPSLMEQYDVLVLPSLHDGWGAVINEALTLGLYAICSDKCGSKYLLKDTEIGQVFKSNSDEDLKKKILYCLKNLCEIRKEVPYRISWARDNINGKSLAEYFLDNLK